MVGYSYILIEHYSPLTCSEFQRLTFINWPGIVRVEIAIARSMIILGTITITIKQGG